MNTKLFFRITAAVISLLTVFSCTKEIDEPIDKPTEPETYTLSIKASKGGDDSTKALSLSGQTLNATWAVGEKVTVYMMVATSPSDPSIKMPIPIGTLEPTNIRSGGTECTLTGELDAATIESNGGINNGDDLVLRFSGSEGGSGMLGVPAQDGTLATIQDYYDIATADVTVSAISDGPGGGRVISTTNAAFENQNAIVKFTLKDKAGNLVIPTSVGIHEEVGGLATDVTLDGDVESNYAANGNCFYFAISGTSGGDFSGDIIITASDGTNDYRYTKTGASFSAGQYYDIAVKMQRVIDLSALSADFVALNGDILTGTRDGTYGISITDGATVTIEDVNITGKGEYNGYPGITCLGDATILLSGTNSVKGGANDNGSGYGSWPGIFVPYEKTLTIDGTGSLDARPGGSNEWAPGIGSSVDGWCGNIVIQGGSVTATGGYRSAGIGGGCFSESACGNITITGSANVSATGGDGAAGIGCGYNTDSSCGNITISTTGTVTAQGGDAGAGIGTGYHGHCGNITISNGTVTATGGDRGAGIGTGHDEGTGYCECGYITITSGVTRVTATKGSSSECSIGKGYSRSNCGSITIGGTLYWNGDAYENDGKTYLKQSSLVYTP